MTLQEKWDRRFKALAEHIARWSSHRGRHIGAVIVGPDQEIRSTGYNGFPRGVDDTIESRYNRADGSKYLWSLCGERNAVSNAARIGVSVRGCTMYIGSEHPDEDPAFPCADCAKEIIQAGIATLVCDAPDTQHPHYGPLVPLALQMFEEAGVKIRYFPLPDDDSTK